MLTSGLLFFKSQQHLDKKTFEFTSDSGLLFQGEQAIKPVNTILRVLAAPAAFVVGGPFLTFALMAAGAGPQWGFIIGFGLASIGCVLVALKRPAHREIFLRTAGGQNYLTFKPTQNWGFSDTSFDGLNGSGNNVVKLRPGSWSVFRSRPLLCLDPVTGRTIVSVANPDDILKQSRRQSTMMDQKGQEIATIDWSFSLPLSATRDFRVLLSKNDTSIPDYAILAVLLYLDSVLVRSFRYNRDITSL